MATVEFEEYEGDVVTFLVHQHDELKGLLSRVLGTQGAERQEAFDAVRESLARHEAAEEEVLRPLTRQAPGGDEEAAMRTGEEDRATEALALLERLDVGSIPFQGGRWDPSVGRGRGERGTSAAARSRCSSGPSRRRCCGTPSRRRRTSSLCCAARTTPRPSAARGWRWRPSRAGAARRRRPPPPAPNFGSRRGDCSGGRPDRPSAQRVAGATGPPLPM